MFKVRTKNHCKITASSCSSLETEYLPIKVTKCKIKLQHETPRRKIKQDNITECNTKTSKTC
jgi:hypothetical protein